MKYFLILLFIILLNEAVNGSIKTEKINENKIVKGNVLYLAAVPSPSHHVWNRVLMKALAKEGFNVTALSADVDKERIANLNYIYMEGVYERMYEGDDPIDLVEMSSLEHLENVRSLYDFCKTACKHLLDSNGFNKLLQYPNDFKFDLVISDNALGPCLLPFIDRFPKAPVISVSPFFMHGMVYVYGGNPIFPSYLPHFVLKLSPNMTFFERLQNSVITALDLYYMMAFIEDQDATLRKYFGPNMKPLSSFGKRSDLYLINAHPAMQHPEALMPNIIHVGGLQIHNPSALPEDIEKFISSGEKGAILFSLGTNMKSALLGQEKIRMFINAIKRLPEYNFLWKFEADTLPELPKNLMVKKWVSQNDILAHPSLKLFLSHTGLLSSQEATWYGVPVLAMPFFGDQPFNTHRMIEDGVAEKLDFFALTEEKIYTTMKNMLENPSYAQKMKQRSTRFRDRPQRPLDLAIFWCKYLIRNGNAKHLQSPAQEMSHFIQHMWDILLVLVGAALTISFLVCRLICSITRRISSSKVKTN